MPKPIPDKQDMIRFLGDVISAEMEKPEGEIDMELVMECDAYLEELLADVEISDEQMTANIAKIKGKVGPAKIISLRPRRMPRPRRIIAAVLAAILIGGSVTAYAFVPAFRDMVRNVLNLGQGSALEDGGVTYIYYGERMKFKNIEEWIESENLDILYPHDLPEHLTIKTIAGTDEESTRMYSIVFIDGVTGIQINPEEIDTSTLSSESEKIVNSHNIISYIKIRKGTIVSTVVHNGWTYYITANTMEDMETILENLY